MNLHGFTKLEAVRLSYDGSGVGYDSKGVVTFVKGLLPGEVAEVQIIEQRKRWQRGEIKEILKKSSLRAEPPCTVFEICGGCQLQHMKYKETLTWKRQWVVDAFKRIGKMNVCVNPPLGMKNPWRYRNKARLHVDETGDLGYYKEKTNEVVRFNDCLLLNEKMNKWIKETESFIKNQLSKVPQKELTWLRNSNQEGMLVLNDEIQISEWEKTEFTGKVSSIARVNKSGKSEFIGNEYLVEKILGQEFRVSPLAFLQVNPEQTEVLYSQVLKLAQLTGKERVWDLYCGIGTITLQLASKSLEVIGVEENPYAKVNAKENALLNGINNTRFYQGKVEEILSQLNEEVLTPDLIVLDPPRAGVHPKGIAEILKANPKTIIYVSCDPGTLARDVAILVKGGYSVKIVQPVDMFPWTGHVEAIILLQRLNT